MPCPERSFISRNPARPAGRKRPSHGDCGRTRGAPRPAPNRALLLRPRAGGRHPPRSRRRAAHAETAGNERRPTGENEKVVQIGNVASHVPSSAPSSPAEYGAMPVTDRYSAHGPVVECEPGSRGRVPRNLLGVRSAREMARCESEALLVATDRMIERTTQDQRCSGASWLGRCGLRPALGAGIAGFGARRRRLHGLAAPMFEGRLDTLNGRRGRDRLEHAALAKNRIAQIGVGSGELGTHN